MISRWPHDAAPFARWVIVGRASETEISDDFYAVAPEHPRRRVLRRIFPGVARNAQWRVALEAALPSEPSSSQSQSQSSQSRSPSWSSRGAAHIVEIGVDAEERLCLVLEEPRALPRWLSAPRSFGVASRMALDAIAIFESTAGLGAWRPALTDHDVEISVDGAVFVRNAGIPAPTVNRATASRVRGDFGGDVRTSSAAAACHLVAAWGFPVPQRTRDAAAGLAAIEAAAVDELPPLVGPASERVTQGALAALGDSDVDELQRVKCALILARTSAVEGEAARLLVQTMNEPLAWLPRVAAELLADWPVPIGLRVDERGLLARCPHSWANTEVVSELGGASIERHCPDCDARVVLPQAAGAFAARCESARAFVADWEERDPVDLVEPNRRRPLWRGQALALEGVDLVNLGGGRVVVRRRTLRGTDEVAPLLPGAPLVVDGRAYHRSGEGITIERLVVRIG